MFPSNGEVEYHEDSFGTRTNASFAFATFAMVIPMAVGTAMALVTGDFDIATETDTMWQPMAFVWSMLYACITSSSLVGMLATVKRPAKAGMAVMSVMTVASSLLYGAFVVYPCLTSSDASMAAWLVLCLAVAVGVPMFAMCGESELVCQLYQRVNMSEHAMRHNVARRFHRMGWRLASLGRRDNGMGRFAIVHGRYVVLGEECTGWFLYDTLTCRIAALPDDGSEREVAVSKAVRAIIDGVEDDDELDGVSIDAKVLPFVSDTDGVVPASRIVWRDLQDGTNGIRWYEPFPYEMSPAEYYHRFV